MKTYATGLSGEEQAESFYLARGGEILARRFRAEDGEIDLIVRLDGFVVFAEVKYRPSGRAGMGMMAVTPAKQRRMAHAALAYLARMQWMDVPVRFDVVEITRDGLRHVPNAFQPG